MNDDAVSAFEEFRLIWRRKDLSKGARMLWWQLRVFCDHANNRQLAWTRAQFEEEFELSHTTRKLLLAELRNADLITVQKLKSGRNVVLVSRPSRGQNLAPGQEQETSLRQESGPRPGAKNLPPIDKNLAPGTGKNLAPAYYSITPESQERISDSFSGVEPRRFALGQESASEASAKAGDSSSGRPKETPPPPISPPPRSEVPNNRTTEQVNWAAALNPTAAEVRRRQKLGARGGLDGSEGVLYDPDTGLLQLVNGVRAAFEREFPGLDLDEACNRAKIDRHTTADDAKRAIRKELSYMRERTKATATQQRPRYMTVEQALAAYSREERAQRGGQ